MDFATGTAGGALMQASRSLILITVDCLRADHAGFMGYGRPTTPFLDCLANESTIFRNAVVAGAPTYYSVPAILASRHALAFGRDLIGMAPDENTIASVLQESGFATAAFSAGNPYISDRFGFHRGFDTFRDFLSSAVSATEVTPPGNGLRNRANKVLSRACHAMPGFGTAYDEAYFQYCQTKTGAPSSLDVLRRFPSADVIADHAIAWLKENSGRPFFLWLHLMDPHAPYFPKTEALELMGNGALAAAEARYLNAYWNRNDLGAVRLAKKRDQIIELYDAGIRWADQQIRRLTESLVEMNLWNRCALAVTADHGEEFLEHGRRFHAPVNLTEELLHVPLLLRVPGERSKIVSSPFGLIDFAPTLLDVLDVPPPADFRGRSCWGAVQNNQPLIRPVITECVHGCSNPFRRDKRLGPRILAVREGNHKLVIDFSSGNDQLFDLESDPSERSPLPVGAFAEIRRELLQCARKHVAESHKSRDFDRRQTMQLHDLRLEWAHSAANIAN
jgi:arylsulfatase A-like enzyme